jgi:hypothetical protein
MPLLLVFLGRINERDFRHQTGATERGVVVSAWGTLTNQPHTSGMAMYFSIADYCGVATSLNASNFRAASENRDLRSLSTGTYGRLM